MLGSVLWAVVVVLVVLWLLGLILHASGIIHLLLIVALIVLVYNLITRSRTSRGV